MRSTSPFRSVSSRTLAAAGLGCCVLLGSLALGQASAAPAPPSGSASSPVSAATPAQTAPQTSAPQTAAPQASAPSEQAGGTISGTVKAGPVPLPGVSVTATNTLTGKKYTTTTDINGSYVMTIPRNGRYVLKAELTGFTATANEALLTAANPKPQVQFSMQLASRVQEQQQTARNQTARAALGMGATTQSLSVLSGDMDAVQAGGDTGASLPSAAAAGGDTATDSVAVNGQMGSVNPLAGVSEDDIRQRIQDMRAQGGNPADLFGGGPGGGPGGGGPGGGRGMRGGGPGGNFSTAFRKFNPAQPHGALFYVAGNSVLNAKDFSISGQPIIQPAYNSNNFGATVSFTPIIPHLLTSTSNFVFFNLTGAKNTTPFDRYATVPTPAERGGDLSGLTSAHGAPVNIYDPATGQQFPGNVIPSSQLTKQALALLNYYPAPNLPGTVQNYQMLTTAGLNSTAINARFIHNFGTAGGGGGGPMGIMRRMTAQQGLRQNLNLGFNSARTASDTMNVFPALQGKLQVHNYAVNLGYTIGYARLTNNLSLNWNHSHNTATNLFTGKTNVAADSAITVGDGSTSSNPFNFGVPGVNFSTFTGFSDAAPSDTIGQTISFTDVSMWIHKKHNVRFGGDFRRIHADSYGGTNIFGGFTFTGYATREPGTQVGAGTQSTGSDFADFLLGLPQQSTVQASNYKHYLRANTWDLFLQDNWRAGPGLTLLYGLRYEYFSPYAEKFDRLANLDYNSSFTEVAQVFPNGIGAITGQKFSHSLLNPDRNMFSPRVGFAYRIARNTVLRGGYGINYNTGQYATMGRQFANQPPFAVTQTNIVAQQGCGILTLANAFNCSGTGSSGLIQANFAANPNYRLGHVQIWNLDVQRTLPDGIVMNIDYNGSHGNSLDDRYAPNVTPDGTLIPYAQSFIFADSLAFSNFNALLVTAQRRLQNGIALTARYQYSHSIDNAASVGGGSGVVAQNPKDLAAEEGNSSFDIRHQVSGTWLYEFPFGPKAKFLNSGNLLSRAIEGWSVSGTYTFTTGTPLTPSYAAAIREVNRGTTGSLRPDRVPVSLISGGGGLTRWFNTSAFSAPVLSSANPFGYGNASRNSIPGPGTVSVNGSLSKTASLGDTRSIEFRATATNIFNVVQYSAVDTTIGTPAYGQVTGAANMRRITMYARFRF